uniref:Uncharacterized protein n=1 Tax=Megaviridae environmental sample TaxID=1737588 RepID=A0A5J6VJ77_9VIRU|nr:MAG: hypothetical protein [Megaviridae environmental sample]
MDKVIANEFKKQDYIICKNTNKYRQLRKQEPNMQKYKYFTKVNTSSNTILEYLLGEKTHSAIIENRITINDTKTRTEYMSMKNPAEFMVDFDSVVNVKHWGHNITMNSIVSKEYPEVDTYDRITIDGIGVRVMDCEEGSMVCIICIIMDDNLHSNLILYHITSMIEQLNSKFNSNSTIC